MGLHYITKYAKYQWDKDTYKHTKQQVKQNYQNRLILGAKKNNVSINKVYFKNEDDNLGNSSEEQEEELCKLLDTNSKCLHIKEVHMNEVVMIPAWSSTESVTSQQQHSLTLQWVWVSFLQGFLTALGTSQKY